MLDSIIINSHKGPYKVTFVDDVFSKLLEGVGVKTHVIIDKRVLNIYRERLSPLLTHYSLLIIDAKEQNKSLDKFPEYVEYLVEKKIRRDHNLLAVGGGIIQDITCFLAATLLRGVSWSFIPTTLLAQADSCIGSKSSINCAHVKNILGTFTPPKEITISTSFLSTLPPEDLRSGVGEMLKVHAISGPRNFNEIASAYPTLFTDHSCMERYIYNSLLIKKSIIEEDEFDLGLRNVMNYGHSFGHAIEAATTYKIPHGIAVTIGMDMANYIAYQYELTSKAYFENLHVTLRENYINYTDHEIPLDLFIAAISRDKKNIGSETLTLILPNNINKIEKQFVRNDSVFLKVCAEYLKVIFHFSIDELQSCG